MTKLFINRIEKLIRYQGSPVISELIITITNSSNIIGASVASFITNHSEQL